MQLIDLAVKSIAVGLIVSSGLPTLAEHWWIFDLFSHFRVQYLFLFGLLGILLMLRRLWRWAIVVLPFVILTSLPVIDHWEGTVAANPSAAQLSIMNVNVNAGNSNYRAFLDHVEQESPDILAIIEFTPEWQRAIEILYGEYPYRIEEPRLGNFGIALFSRVPLADGESFELENSMAISARVDLAGQTLRVLAVHLRPPLSGQWSGIRSQQLEELGARLMTRSEAIVVTGDFNITPYSPLFSGWLRRNRLRHATRPNQSTVSWPTGFPLLGIFIDHCVVNENLTINELSRGPAFGSDHYPLTARVSFRSML